MPYVAPIVGYDDSQGYTCCPEHIREGFEQFPIYGDAYFTEDDKCNRCGKQFEHVQSAAYVWEDWKPHTR